ncbi:hypothetical protein [Altererythrobacter sp.]|uniref:hypothetical protein n=1 Tax=Altererythrobacter sp. TaxID=1872480 RepID=UPI003D059E4B
MNRAIAYSIASAALCYASVAVAATSTYTTTGGPEKTTGNEQYQGSYQEGTSVVTFSDGTQVNENWTCIGVSQPPNAKLFDFHFACDASGPSGTYSMIFGCNNVENGMQGCVGGLNGKTGIYEGKNGATTWAGQGGSGSGTMQWAD